MRETPTGTFGCLQDALLAAIRLGTGAVASFVGQPPRKPLRVPAASRALGRQELKIETTGSRCREENEDRYEYLYVEWYCIYEAGHDTTSAQSCFVVEVAGQSLSESHVPSPMPGLVSGEAGRCYH